MPPPTNVYTGSNGVFQDPGATYFGATGLILAAGVAGTEYVVSDTGAGGIKALSALGSGKFIARVGYGSATIGPVTYTSGVASGSASGQGIVAAIENTGQAAT